MASLAITGICWPTVLIGMTASREIGRIVKTDDLVGVREFPVFLKQDIQKNIGMCVIWHKDSLLFPRIFLFQMVCERRDPLSVFFKTVPEMCEDQVIGKMMFSAYIYESMDSSGGR